MSLDMTHEDVRAALAAEALDALDGPERAAVLAHLDGCADCRRELAELRQAAAALAHAVPPRPMEAARSARLRGRLLARAAADRGADGRADGPASDGLASGGDTTLLRPADDVTRVRASPAREDDVTLLRPAPAAADRLATADAGVVPIDRARSRRFGGGWLAAAASVLLMVAAAAYALSLQGRLRDRESRLAALEEERGTLRLAVAERDRAIQELAGPEVRVIELAATQPQAPSGRMFWDPGTGTWTFFAHHFPALRPGRDYQLWVITSEGPQPAEAFEVDSIGHAVVRMKHSASPGQVRAVAVTEEPDGGRPTPSGTPFLVGTTGSTE